jgi:hypothetical protein
MLLRKKKRSIGWLRLIPNLRSIPPVHLWLKGLVALLGALLVH